MEYDLYRNTFVRKGLAVDRKMVQQSQDNYSLFDDWEDAVVMDWGMNIGGFGRMLLDKPIKKYIGVECHPENFEVAKKNLGDDDRFVLINAAVTSVDIENIYLYLTDSKQAFCSGTINPSSTKALGLRKHKIAVPTVNYLELFEEHKPTHLKCDIEGEEYRIFEPIDWNIYDTIKQFALELHWGNKILNEYEYNVRQPLLDQNFTPALESLAWVHGDNKKAIFLGEEINYRNIWGLDCLFKR